MADTDILIAIKTTADTAGAEQTVDAIKKIEAEDLSLQQQRDARTKGRNYATTTFVDPEAEEAAARRAAAAAEIAAAEQEAAAVRAARASAEKALAEQSAAVKIEAALAKETAAAEAQALADEAIANKKIANAAVRALTPRNRQLGAAMSIANSPAAMAALVTPVTIAAGAVVALGVVSSQVFGGIEADMNKATAAGSKFEDEHIKMAAAIHTLGSPLQAVKQGISGAWDMVTTAFSHIGSDAIELAEDIAGTHHMATLKMEADTAYDAESFKEQCNLKASYHEAMTKKFLADELALHTALDNLAKGREQRAGTAGDEVAANEITRQIKKTADEDAQIMAAITAAQRVEAANLGTESEEAGKAWRKLTEDLVQKQKIDSVNLTNKVEESQGKVKDELEKKLTDNAKSLQTDLQAIVDSQGAKSSPITRQALQQVNALLEDDKVTAEEANKLKAAAALFKQSADARSTEQQQFITDLQAGDKAAVEQATKLSAQIESSTRLQVANAAAIAKSVDAGAKEVGAAVTAQGDTIVAALKEVTRKLAAQQQQINQINISR